MGTRLAGGSLRDLATLLASPNPADHLVGLGRVQSLEGPGRLPVLLHVLRTCDPGLRAILLERIARFGSPAIGRVIEQLLESDPPHPQSAIHYVTLVRESHYDSILREQLPRLEAGLREQVERFLATNASAPSALPPARASSRLEPSPRLPVSPQAPPPARFPARAEPRYAFSRSPVPPGRSAKGAAAGRRLSLSLPSVHWVPPTPADVAVWIGSSALSARMLWESRAPSTPMELFALIALAFSTARCLADWPSAEFLARLARAGV